MNDVEAKVKYEQLIRDGYCVVEKVLDDALLRQILEASKELLRHQTEEEARLHRSTGSMISVIKDARFADLIACPDALQVLASLGFPRPAFNGGFVISKPPQSPRLFWHYDYAGWDDPDSFSDKPHQVFLMYYLVDTTPHNGCLRVIPGTHLHDNSLHAELEEAHTTELLETRNLESPEFSTRPDEVDVPVKAGDLVIGDARLIHAAHANQSNDRRTVITLWYHPHPEGLSEQEQAFVAMRSREVPKMEGWEDWPEQNKRKLEPLFFRYEGTAKDLPWNRKRPMRGM